MTFLLMRGRPDESPRRRRNFSAITLQCAANAGNWRFETMAPRSPQARLRLAAVAMTAALVWTAGAGADVLHAIYRVSLIGLPIGAVNLYADLTPTSYSIAGDAKVTGIAKLFVANPTEASAGKG